MGLDYKFDGSLLVKGEVQYHSTKDAHRNPEPILTLRRK